MKKIQCDNVSVYLTCIYAISLIIFGCIGFFKGGSLISLYLGAGIGVLLLNCSFGMRKNLRFCTYGTLSLIAILMASFFFRAHVSQKIVPTLLGLLSLCVFLVLFYRAMRK